MQTGAVRLMSCTQVICSTVARFCRHLLHIVTAEVFKQCLSTARVFVCEEGDSKSYVWLGSVVVRTLDLQSTGRRFDSRPPHCRVATLDKSFTHVQRSASEVTTV